MKRIYLLLIIAVAIKANAHCQDFNLPIDSTGNVVYQEVITCSIAKNDLYANAQEWIAKTFGDYKSVIQFEDESNGKLILKGIAPVKHSVESYFAGMDLSNREEVHFTLSIECREKKYRYTMDNITIILKTGGGGVFSSSIFERINLVQSSKERIEMVRQDLNELKSIDTAPFKKKQLKEHQNLITKLEQEINSESARIKGEIEFIESEVDAIETIISSLKNSMSKIDDF